MRRILVIFSLPLLLWIAPSLAKEPTVAEQDFFVAYDKLYQAAAEFETTLKTITPPKGFVYTKENLADYRRLLDDLFTSKPEYRTLTERDVAEDPKAKEFAKALGKTIEELGLHKESAVLAAMTGLPHRELAVYQKAKGASGLKKLLQSVQNLQNPQWVAWYLTLTNHGDPVTEKSLFLGGASHPQAAAHRENYGKASKEFAIVRESLLRVDEAAFKAAKGEKEKSRVAITMYIHNYIAARSGKVGWLSEQRASYPVTNADPGRQPQVAKLAEAFGIPFSDLAYIKKREGDLGVQRVLRALTWVNDRDSIINAAFK